MKRVAAACWMACPAVTEPVKATKSTPPLSPLPATRRSACSWLQWSAWKTPAGREAASKACAKRSAHSGVCAECRRITAFPASSAGTTEFTAVR